MKIGYARVSTYEQNLSLQMDALTKAGCEKVFHDHIGGAKTKRAGLDETLAEFERALIRERTIAGLEAARARGKRGGRPKPLNSQQKALLGRLYDEKEHSIQAICELISTRAYILWRLHSGKIPKNFCSGT